MIDDLVARALAAPPRCGTTRLVCIDGPSGAGKTQLAVQLQVALGNPPLLHMDDLYPGWDGLAAGVALLRSDVVAPLAAGRPARYHRWDWALAAYAEFHDLGTPPLLIVEGVGAGAATSTHTAVATGAGELTTRAAGPGAGAGTARAGAVAGAVARTEAAGPPSRLTEPAASLLVWLDASQEVRYRRAIERDGATYASHWDRWATQERAHFAADRTRDRADVAFCFR